VIELIKNISQAYFLFKELLKERGGEVIRVVPENYGRHRVVYAKMHYRGSSKIFKFYLVFQREWFKSFSKFYNFQSEACTLNMSILQNCLASGVDRIVFVNKHGVMLMISPQQFLEKAKENRWIRKTKKTGEEVAHIPITLMKKLEFRRRQSTLEKFI